MRWRTIAGLIGILLVFLALAMGLPFSASLYFQDQAHVMFLKSMGITMTAGLFLMLVSGKTGSDKYISQKEGMAVVAMGWTAIGLFGGLPFYFSPDFTTFTDAFFESVSGFTTTGSSIMTRIEGTANSILLWRSFIQWLGGMGIIVLSLAILPFLGVGGIQLYKAEVPSPMPDKLAPRLSDSAKILWVVYAGISIFLTIFLLAGGMPLFDALCHTFTTMPTGGFSPRNASIAAYDNAYFDYVIVVFMLLAGINFSLHYQMLRGKTLIFWKNTECRFFLGLVTVFTLLVTWNTYGNVYQDIGDAFRYAVFQVTSILTTTGFATADYEMFPGLSQVILFVCMFIGGCAGSTAGGMKCARIIACFKYCYRELFQLIHPRSVTRIRINNHVISDDLLRSIMGFLALYIGLYIISSILLAGLGLDMVTAFSATAACIGNIGPGFGTVGPADNFAHIPVAGKWLLIWCMLLGRLEIYTVIILFVPEFWKK